MKTKNQEEGEYLLPHINKIMRNTKIIQLLDDRNSENLKAYFKSISKYKTLTAKEERELYKRILDGDESAKNKLIESNLRLVISIAKKYQGYGLSLMDLIQEGNNGLLASISHYDMEKKTRFTTCASWWIKSFIKKAIGDYGRIFKLPSNAHNNYRKVRKLIDKFEQEYGRPPYPSEIEDKIKLNKKQIEIAMSPLDVSIPIEVTSGVCKTEMSFSDKYIDENTELTDKLSEEESLKETVNDILSKLSEREEKILRMIFGIGCEEKSIKEIAKMSGLTYERIRQIKKVALEKLKLRHPSLRKELFNK